MTAEVIATITSTVDNLGLPWERVGDIVTVTLPGTRKLKTDCAWAVGEYAVDIRAFVVRRPDENQEAVYRWLLEHNLKTYAVAFSVDRHGDIYLTGRMALAAITPTEVDRILGAVAETADDSFNTLLELGFSSSIRKEWQWRLSRGESTANLEAFRHLAPESPPDARTMD
ncbi:MAG: YbjN domain-containing protein [Propionibacteriaceae bacterium]|nr:YbjN domain-containing protein [Propionibacteriaceae bacterium]